MILGKSKTIFLILTIILLSNNSISEDTIHEETVVNFQGTQTGETSPYCKDSIKSLERHDESNKEVTEVEHVKSI